MDSWGESRQLSRLQAVTDAALAHLELEELLGELLQRIRAICVAAEPGAHGACFELVLPRG